MADFLCLKGHQNSQCLGGQGAKCVNAPEPQGQCRNQTIRLLVVERGKLAEVLPSNGLEGFRVAVQLLLAVCQMYQRYQCKQHPLIPGGEIVQYLPYLLSLLLQVIGHNGGEIVVAVLAALPVCHIRLHPQ